MEAQRWDAVLESFLHDMEALDRQADQAETPLDLHVKNQPKKRSLEAPTEPQTIAYKSPPLAIKKQRTPTWLRRKAELLTLRQETEALETRVVYLERKKAASKGGLEAEKVKKQRLQAAQSENDRLKTRLQLYSKQAEALQAVLTLADSQRIETLQTTWAFMRGIPIEMGAGRQLRGGSAGLFDMLEQRVDGRFCELQDALRVMQQPMLTTDTNLVETHCNNGERAVEFTRLELMPFEEQAISSTLWSFVEAGRFPDGEDTTVIRRSSDVLTMSSRVAVQMNRGQTITIDTHCVMKRLVVPRGVAFMTEACSSWTATQSAGSTWSHTTRERGCFVMRSYALGDGVSPDICQARFEVCLNPGEVAEEARSDPVAKACTINEVVIPSFRQLVNARHQFMQNALFDAIRRNQ